MFLGTPQYSTTVLGGLFRAAKDSHTSRQPFEVCAVVSSAGRSTSQSWMSHVERLARAEGLSDDSIIATKTGKEASFLARVRALAPDLCVTAGFGVMLTQQFLDVPALGTVNVHASLLPKYRGAAAVMRCLEAGEHETGVSLLFTALRCDAGPIIDQIKVPVSPHINACDLTDQLMDLGTGLLLRQLPALLAGQALAMAVPQDEQAATYAPKVSKADEWLDVRLPAAHVHNKVRALLSPGGAHGRKWHRSARTRLVVLTRAGAEQVAAERAAALSSAGSPPTSYKGLEHAAGVTKSLRIIRTRPLSALEASQLPATPLPEPLRTVAVLFLGDRVLMPCAQGTYLELLEISMSPNVPIKELRHALQVGKQQIVVVDQPGETLSVNG